MCFALIVQAGAGAGLSLPLAWEDAILVHRGVLRNCVQMFVPQAN